MASRSHQNQHLGGRQRRHRGKARPKWSERHTGVSLSLVTAITASARLGERVIEYAPPASNIESRFKSLVAKWKAETLHTSSVKKMVNQPYLGIIGMGPKVLPLLLKELSERPDHWLIALNAITQEDPAPSGSTFQEAVSAWLKWGRERNYLA